MKAAVVFTHNASDRIVGSAELADSLSGVRVRLAIQGLSKGKHGFHIHRLGDLRIGCNGVCDHYNPTHSHHGSRCSAQRHLGDLGNVVSPGAAQWTRAALTAHGVKVEELLGRSLVIHADEDDLGKGGDAESLKTGNSGARVACGVIGRA